MSQVTPKSAALTFWPSPSNRANQQQIIGIQSFILSVAETKKSCCLIDLICTMMKQTLALLFLLVVSCGAQVAFTDTQALYDAVDNYLQNPSSNLTAAAVTYGYPIGSWDVSQITNFSRVFNADRSIPFDGKSCGTIQSTFNEDISGWNVANAVNMEGMFACSQFNRDLSRWQVGNVQNMSGIFMFATNFNQNISAWNVGNVKDFSYAFAGATSFSGDLSAWNVASATDLSWMVSAIQYRSIDETKRNCVELMPVCFALYT
jgi:surface protein